MGKKEGAHLVAEKYYVDKFRRSRGLNWVVKQFFII